MKYIYLLLIILSTTCCGLTNQKNPFAPEKFCNNITKKDIDLTFAGTSDPDEMIEFYDGVLSLGITNANVLGKWTKDLSLSEGIHNITAYQTDVAGNLSSPSGQLSITVDKSALPPSGFDLADTDDTGISSSDNITKNTSALTLSGLSEKDATVDLYDNGVYIYSIKSNGSGSWTKELALSDSDKLKPFSR